MRFGHTPERRAILGGLLDLRARLRAVGLAPGFQWLDGSFAEDVERFASRAPRDIDVVTFVALGDGVRQLSMVESDPDLFDPAHVKAVLLVDHYFMPTDRALDVVQAGTIGYWHSMWSHDRAHRWKGFVEVLLLEDAAEDDLAREWLMAHDPPTGDDGVRDEP